jgi:hypothetical protein
MIPEPKFKAGDKVKIKDKTDPFYGEVQTIERLSPSTQKRRSRGQWRYELTGGTWGLVRDENQLEKVG